jgi:copper chaperone
VDISCKKRVRTKTNRVNTRFAGIVAEKEENTMEKIVLNVEGMSCEHCVKAVTGAVGALPGVSGVVVDLAAKTVTVEHVPGTAPVEKINAELEEQGYDGV